MLGGCVLLGGCAASPHSGRAQLTAPAPVSAAYSEMKMQMTLVTMPDGSAGVGQTASDAPVTFEQRVARIGMELARVAYELHPELRDRVEKFEFIIADKSEAGTVSTSYGRIVILRPVSSLAPADAALAFVVAREMAHVIANHHGENTATSLVVSGLAYILFPVAGLAKALSSAFPSGAVAAGASSTVTANTSATAASLVGSRVLVLSYQPKQQEEADALALVLLGRLGYGAPAVAAGFAKVDLKSQTNEWAAALQASLDRLASVGYELD
jgi:predicted Zn-dependent protease